MKFIVTVAVVLFSSSLANSDTWPMLRADASASGARLAGKPFVAGEADIKAAVADLASPDVAKALRARLTLKRAGADAVDALKTAGDGGKTILETLAKPEILWKFQAEEFFAGSPAFDEKAVYAADRAGWLYAVEKLAGKALWKTKLPALTNGTPVPSGDTVYVGCHDGSVLRVKKADGTVVWTFKADPAATPDSWAFVWDSVAIDDKNVCFATASGKVFAVSIDKGEKVWEFTADKMTVDGKEQDGRFFATPALADDGVYVGSQNGKFYCLSRADGHKVWEYTAPAGISRAAALGKTSVFFVAEKELVALDRAKGEKAWSFTSERKYASAPTVYGDYVLAAGDFGRTYVLDASTGKVAWSGNLPGNADGSLEVVNDRIYFTSTDMQLTCANFRSLIPVWTFSTPKGGATKTPSCAVDDGVVYITTRQTARTNNPDEMAISKCIVAVAEPSDNLYGLNTNTVAWGLDEVGRRVLARHNKPYALLKNGGAFSQSETLVFTDPRTGSEIIRFSDDPSANYHHSSINRPSYSSDGSHLVLHSGRAYNPGRYILRADGSGFRRIDLNPFVLNYGIHPTWDRKAGNIVYTCDRTAVYKVDVETFQTTKVCDLPDPDVAKSIFSYPSADDTLLLMLGGTKVYLVKTDGSGVKVVNLPNPKAAELAPKHDVKFESQGAHDIYFTLNASNTFMFNYGPTATVGEGIFFEMDTEGNLLRVVFPYKDPDKGSDPIYYSHPAYRHDGKKIAYFGYGGGRRGWGFFLRDADGSNPVKLCEYNIGGHCGWDNYDDEWIFASPSVSRDGNPVGGNIIRCRTDGSMTTDILCEAHGANDNPSYSAIPRVSPSPDGTKAVFTTAMLGTSSWMDMFSVVAKRPDPPVSVVANGRAIAWEPPRLAREVMGYNVYTSPTGEFWKLITPEPVRETRFPAPGDGLYVVTSVEWSGLESLAVSGTVAIGFAKPVFLLDAEYAEYKLPLKEIRDTTAANWFALECAGGEEGKAVLKFKSTVEDDYIAFVRIRCGDWDFVANNARPFRVGNYERTWKWVKIPAPVRVVKGENSILLATDGLGTAIDKVVLTANPNIAPDGLMYLDTTPPAKPALDAKRLDRALVELTWTGPTDPDVRYYNVYYSAAEQEAPTKQAFRIASPAKCERRYVDFAPRPGVAGHYALTAVDRFGNESAPARVSVP